jgi:hypothetical protein
MRHDFLYDFLHALDTYQQKACREYLLASGSKWQAQYLLMFDMLLEMERYDPQALVSAFEGTAFSKALNMERHRLGTLLMHATMDHRRRTDRSADPWSYLEEARLLLELGHAQEAADMARSGIDVAGLVHDVHAELALRELLRSSFRALPRAGLIAQITDNDYRLALTAAKVANLTRFTAIFDSLSDYQLKFRVADDISVRSAMEALMADDLLADMGNAISLPAQIRFASIWAFYSEFIGRLEDAERHHNQCLSLWESSPHRITYLPHLYREALANLIGLLVRVGDLGQIPLLLKRMEQVRVNGRRAEVMAFCDVELQHQFYYMNTGEFEKAVERERAVNGGLTRFGRQMPESKELTLLYNYGVIQLVMGNDRMAKQYFSRIRDKGDLGSRFDLQSIARIFRLLLLMEDDTQNNFGHYLRSNRRTFRKKMPFYRMEEVLYRWMGRHQSDYHTDGRRRFLMELFNALRPFEHERLVGAEEFRLWALSRATGQPMRQLLGTTRDK